MSQYPYGYPSQGQPPPQQYPPYQPYTTYPTPNGYAPQPTQQYSQLPAQPSTPGNYYATSQLAYNHNASSIPGLGTPAASAFPVPFSESWNSNYGTSTPSAKYPPYNLPVSTSSVNPTSSGHHSQTVDLGPKAESTWSFRDPSDQEASKGTTNAKSREEPSANGSEEEGEISEPDFDDLYDDVSNQVSAAPQTVATSAKDTHGSAANNSDQEPDFYDTEDEGNPTTSEALDPASKVASQQSNKLPNETERERSRSYSPYLSPREIDQYSSLTLKDSVPGAEVASKASDGIVDPSKHPGSSFGANGTVEDQATAQGTNSSPALNESAVAANGAKVYANVSEAQNEAKKAILRLLPHGVKYQTYIDEGFDAQIVKELFSQLHLPTDPAVATAPERSTTNKEKEKSKPPTETLQTSQTDTMAKKQEERKDKIARLLAEKKAKAAVSASNAQPTVEPKSIKNTTNQTSATPTKPLKTRAEMDRLLQQKMEALRQKAAQKTSASTTPKTTGGDKVTTPSLTAGANSAGARYESAAGTPVSVDLGGVSTQDTAAQSLRDSSGIPSSVHSPLPYSPKVTQAATQRKRPVAADFMDYPPTSIKRPSLANRQNSSLVISLSEDEDEDEDEDVEMEVDSADESPAPVSQSITLPKRGPSIRDFPPLTNRNSPRQLASPAPGASPAGGNGDLEARERQIMDLKRRIQEAEARAKNKPKKRSATPQTPSAGNITPVELPPKPPARPTLSSSDIDDKGGPSAQLLQEAEAATNRHVSDHPPIQLVDDERPSRVSSVQLPVKSDKLREKAERLRKMQEEMMKLQAEINEDMAEEEGLGDEIGTNNDDVDTAASTSMIQTADAVNEGSDAAQSDDATPEIRDMAQQFDDSVPAISTDVEILDDHEEKMDISSSDSDEGSPLLSPLPPPQPASLSPQSVQQEEDLASSADDQRSNVAEVVEDFSPDVADVVGANASDDYEPPGAQSDDHIAEGSPPFSPALADHTEGSTGTQRQTNADLQRRLAELRSQLISAKASKEQMATAQSSGVEERSREADNNDSSMPTTSFVPYDSPLRYFRAYRFHPRYSDEVASGLKSLTYSSRIDPKKEMCPDELDGPECPRGDACQFQHFRSIVAPDNEIILDLGSSDDLSGDQKKNFNNGLRELVANFQQSKVRDFGTIAQAIVEFRRRFFGDATRILRLEGVNI